MLTGKLVRVRHGRYGIAPRYIKVRDATWQTVAEQLLAVFREQVGRTRGELEEDLRETFGSDPAQLVHQGLAKLLEDRCEFEVVSGHPPEQLRNLVFRTATAHRQKMASGPLAEGFDRGPVLREVADQLGLPTETVEQGLFADLKSEQRLIQ